VNSKVFAAVTPQMSPTRPRLKEQRWNKKEKNNAANGESVSNDLEKIEPQQRPKKNLPN